MKALHFICMNFCFVSIHFATRFTHNNHGSIRDNNHAIVFQIADFFLQPNLKKAFLTLHTCVNTTPYIPTQHIFKQITWRVFILGHYIINPELI